MDKRGKEELHKLRELIEPFRRREYEKARQIRQIRDEAEMEHRKRMQTLDDVPPWIQAARIDVKERKMTGKEAPKPKIEGVAGEGSGPLR